MHLWATVDTNCDLCKLVQLLLFVTTDMMLGRHFFFDARVRVKSSVKGSVSVVQDLVLGH